jgi:hypothetical protein
VDEEGIIVSARFQPKEIHEAKPCCKELFLSKPSRIEDLVERRSFNGTSPKTKPVSGVHRRIRPLAPGTSLGELPVLPCGLALVYRWLLPPPFPQGFPLFVL